MITIGQGGPQAGPEDPLGWIEACHARIESRLATLGRLVAHHSAHGADAGLARAIESIVRYFDEAAPNHHADEDADLFPRLCSHALARGDAGVVAALDEAGMDHGPLEAAWAELRADLLAVDDSRGPDPLRIEPFVTAYRRHLRIESDTILPAARRWLGTDECREIGAAMARRRGIGAGGSAVFVYPPG
ncbi:MAG: hemerythrin domain-containing protein [Pseudomonadota bacterium]|nr:hemerythrin domain-containing protein [Pseudomonadota bacterium]